MKRKDSRRRIRIFYGILMVPTILWAVLSLVGAGRFLDFDTGEKRNKHVIAEDTKLSNVTAELETYYDDRVPFRSVLLSVNSTLNWIIELPYSKVIEPALIHLANASMERSAAGEAGSAVAEASGGYGAEVDPGAAGMDSNGANGVLNGAGMNSDGAGIDAAGASGAVNGAGMDSNSGSGALNGAGMDSDGANGAVNGAGLNSGADGMEPDGGGEEAFSTLQVLSPYYESPVEAGFYPYKELSYEVIQGRDNWLFTTESYADFLGANMPSEEQLAEKLGRMEMLNQICQSRGIPLHIVAMPNKNTVYPEYMPSVEQVEYSAVNALEDYVHNNSSISFHFFDDEMLGAKVYGRLYYETDTHWNNRGGLAASAYIRNIFGLPPIDLGAIGSEELDPYLGDLAVYSGLPAASFNPDSSVNMFYRPEVAQQLVRGGDDYIDEVVSQNTESTQTLVVVGDSYRHSLLPFLSRDFAHVYSISETRMDESVADILKSADIILLEGVERNFFFLSHFDETVERLIELMS